VQSVVCAGHTLIVSPHLDDAVLSCGRFLATHEQATVMTVLAGMPSGELPLTDYDSSCGFESCTQAMRTRWQEDERALACLAAKHLHLDVLDSQYAALPAVRALAARLEPLLLDPQWDMVAVPMGLFHCDHECVSDACMTVLARAWLQSPAQWVVFEDVPYRRRWGVMQARLAAWFDQGWILTPVALEPQRASSNAGQVVVGQADVDEKQDVNREPGAGVGRVSDDVEWVDDRSALRAKQKALACYASQLHTLGLAHGGDQDAPERFWSVTPR